MKIVVSVKGGNLKADDVRSLNHVRESEKAEIDLFISLNEPTVGMKSGAAATGFHTTKTARSSIEFNFLRSKGFFQVSSERSIPTTLPT